MTENRRFTDQFTYLQKEYSNLIGRTIKFVRPMHDEEIEDFGWEAGYGSIPMVLILDDNTVVIPSMDPEGNGPGHLFVESLQPQDN